MPGRTWIIAPDVETLNARWTRLIEENDLTKKEMLFHPHEGGDKTVQKLRKQDWSDTNTEVRLYKKTTNRPSRRHAMGFDLSTDNGSFQTGV